MATSIDGYVRDKNGEGLENAYVTGAGGSDYTNSGGHYWYYCSPGTYTITTSKAGYVTESQSAYLQYNHATTVDFTVASGHPVHASIEGIALNNSGNPEPNMMVWAVGIFGNVVRYGCSTQSDGTYILPIFTAGDYMVECGKNNFDIISAYHYIQAGIYPTTTTTVDFIGGFAACRKESEDNKLCISDRSIVVPDDLTESYYNVTDIPATNIVFAKVRKWSGSSLPVYASQAWNAYVADGSGGSQYD